jgi:hypothetical protein
MNADLPLVFLSVVVQIPLALLLGHYYDQRVLMVTGYLVSSGLNPYQPHEIVGVFSHPLLQGILPRLGYPPPIALMTGSAFNLSYQIVPNLYFYNFVLKIPIIASNICLAFLVRKIILDLNASQKQARFAFAFLLFNPFTLLTSSAWGQFDTIIALLCVASLYLLIKKRKNCCAFTSALAFSIKPIALPLLGLPLFFNNPKRWIIRFKYVGILVAAVFIFYALPFFIFGWQLPTAPDSFIAHFTTAGGLSPFGVVEVINDTLFLPSSLEFLGFLWVPALLFAYYSIYRNPPSSKTELIQKAIGLFLIFFLTRSWLSEPNINLILPLMLILTAAGTEKLRFRNFHFIWIIPFFFMFLNYSIPSLFFIPYPNVITNLAMLDAQIRSWRLIGKLALTVLWQVLAWMLLFRVFLLKKQQSYNQR